MIKARYEVRDWTTDLPVVFFTNNIHEAREMLAGAASLGFNSSTTYIWDGENARPVGVKGAA